MSTRDGYADTRIDGMTGFLRSACARRPRRTVNWLLTSSEMSRLLSARSRPSRLPRSVLCLIAARCATARSVVARWPEGVNGLEVIMTFRRYVAWPHMRFRRRTPKHAFNSFSHFLLNLRSLLPPPSVSALVHTHHRHNHAGRGNAFRSMTIRTCRISQIPRPVLILSSLALRPAWLLMYLAHPLPLHLVHRTRPMTTMLTRSASRKRISTPSPPSTSSSQTT